MCACVFSPPTPILGILEFLCLLFFFIVFHPQSVFRVLSLPYAFSAKSHFSQKKSLKFCISEASFIFILSCWFVLGFFTPAVYLYLLSIFLERVFLFFTSICGRCLNFPVWYKQTWKTLSLILLSLLSLVAWRASTSLTSDSLASFSLGMRLQFAVVLCLETVWLRQLWGGFFTVAWFLFVHFKSSNNHLTPIWTFIF